VIAILDQPGARRQHKLHKSIAEVTFADVAALKRGTLTNTARNQVF
jgi:hypothetical protein